MLHTHFACCTKQGEVSNITRWKPETIQKEKNKILLP
jgi:hypothetical protein